MATKADVHEFVDPDLGRMVAAQEIRICIGCAYEKLRCPEGDEESPACVSHQRKDNRNIIWVLTQNVPNPTSLMEVNALLDEVLSMVDELGDRLACMGKALEEAEVRRLTAERDALVRQNATPLIRIDAALAAKGE